MIKALNLTKKFGSTIALENIDFTLHDGEGVTKQSTAVKGNESSELNK